MWTVRVTLEAARSLTLAATGVFVDPSSMRQSISMARLKQFALIVCVSLLGFTLHGCGGGGSNGGGQSTIPAEPTPPQQAAYFDSTTYSTAAAASLSQPNELAAVTQHQMVVNGAALAYTATAGHLTARHPATGAPEASFFYVAYTLPGRDPATRPVTSRHGARPEAFHHQRLIAAELRPWIGTLQSLTQTWLTTNSSLRSGALCLRR